MKSLYYINPNSILPSLTYPEIADWKSMYRAISYAVGLIDRSNQFIQPINISVYSGCKLPLLQTQPLTYKDCCNNRAAELWELSGRLQKPLGIMWSGGIDSTRMLISFLENYPLSEIKDRIRILTSYDAVVENQEFFRKYIAGNLPIINSESIPLLFDKSIILLTGEHNDQLFGSDMLKSFMLDRPDIFHSNFSKDIIFSYLNAKIKIDKVTSILIDAVCRSASTYGITIEKNADWFWWWNFCFKWQSVNFRLMVLCSPKLWSNISEEFMNTYLHHFYDSTDFQLWSINSQDVRNITKWIDYKKQAKVEIFEFDKNQDYLDNKLKKPSLRTIYVQRTVFEGIDTNFNIIPKLDLADIYLPDNEFKI